MSIITLGLDRGIFWVELSFRPSIIIPLYFGSLIFGVISFIYVEVNEIHNQNMAEPSHNRLLSWISTKTNVFLVFYLIIAFTFGISTLLFDSLSITIHLYWIFFKFARIGFLFISFYGYWVSHLATDNLRQNMKTIIQENPTIYTMAYSIAFDEQDSALPKTHRFVQEELIALQISEPQLSQLAEHFLTKIQFELGSTDSLKKESFGWVN